MIASNLGTRLGSFVGMVSTLPLDGGILLPSWKERTVLKHLAKVTYTKPNPAGENAFIQVNSLPKRK